MSTFDPNQQPQQPFQPQQPYQQPGYPMARPPLNPSDERMWATLVHLSPLIGFALWAPLIVWLVFRGRGPFLEHQAKQALNFHITVTIASIVTLVLGVVTMGLAMPLLFVVLLVMTVFAILASVASSKGVWYVYPMTITFVR